jgi:diguanylate cyclase (GGDEF)-like protein
MAVQKYDIAILSRRKTVIKFLKNFLKGKRIYKPHFFSIPDLFITYLSDNPPQALLIEDSFLPVVSERILKFPTIVIIAGDIKIGIENAINYNVNRYIYKPYMDKDLEYKLESIILEKDSIEKMKNEIKELEVITGLTQVISSTLDPQEILFRIVRQIAEVMPVTRCSIIRVDWLRRYAFVVASFEDPTITGIKLSLKKYPEILAALTAKKPVVIEDVRTDPIMKKVQKIIEPLDIRSILVIPILFKEKVIGTLFLRTARSGRTFSENEIRLLNAIGSASSNALHNAFLFEQIEDEKTRLEKLAITDYLTGIYNIRYFYHRIIEEFSRCERYAFPISCLMLDIDHFKVINDVYGHKTGDKVLKEFSQLLKKCTRRSDVLARYGGEEFIVLLPQTSDEGAFLEAERLRKAVKGHKFKSIKAQRKLTSSFGVATYPNKDIKSHDELISAADDALFKAKNSGRDRVEVCGR